MTVADVTGVDLAPHAVLRAAAWPIETVDDFAAPEPAGAATALRAAEQEVIARRARFSAVVHDAVPWVENRRVRAWLLAVRRHAHGTTSPLPPPPAGCHPADLLSPELARLIVEEDGVRRALAGRRTAFEQAYAAELARQRAALHRHAGEERFRKALLLANPRAAARWRAGGEAADPCTARGRRLEATLFHCLMRAAGRPTPQGAWAGVAPVATAPGRGDLGGLTVDPAPGRYTASVSLEPFAIMLRALARSPRYRWGRPLRLNPTLFADDHGWRYEHRTGAGAVWERLAPNPLCAALLEYFAHGGPRPLQPLLDRLAPASTAPDLREKLERALAVLIDRDLLQPDLDLPAVAGTCWDALDATLPDLAEPEHGRWAAAIGRIRAMCERLAADYEALDAAGVDALRRSVADELATLWRDAGLPGEPPGPAVYLDMRLPMRVTWSETSAAAAARAVRAMFAFYAQDGGAELFRRLMLRGLVPSIGGRAVPLPAVFAASPAEQASAPEEQDEDVSAAAPEPWRDSREAVFAQFFGTEGVREAVAAQSAALTRLLAPVHDRPRFVLPPVAAADVPPGPAGAVLLSPTGDGQVWLGLVRPQPGLFAARFAEVLGEAAAPLLDVLRRHADVAARAGVTLVDIAGRDPLNPNAALRPAVTPRTLDPHARAGLLPRDLELLLEPRTCRPWLRTVQTGALLAPVYCSGAAIGDDGCSRLLYGLAMAHGWEFLSFGFPATRAERTEWHHLPRLLLDGGAVLSPERWTLDRETVARLVACQDADRYLAWREVGDRLGLPPLVRVGWGPDTPDLLLRTDSPLALRCLFDTVGARAPFLVLSELPGSPADWPIRDQAGRHYAAELGVEWHADGYWHAVVPEGHHDRQA